MSKEWDASNLEFHALFILKESASVARIWGVKVLSKLNEELVQAVLNDKDSGEIGAKSVCCNDEARIEEEMEEVVECMSMGKKDCRGIAVESNTINVSESVSIESVPVDTIRIETKSDEKIDSQKNVVNNISFIKALSRNLIESDNKLFTVPTSVNEKGEEVVIFYKDLVNEGRECVGKHALRDIVVNNEEICFAKFKDEDGMNLVIEQSPWMVNGRPLYRLGWPIMMDKMTADMCNRSTGRLGYARVLVEIEACKGFLDNIEIIYVDKQNSKKNSKWVKFEYSWKPMVCNHCKVFGHSFYKYTQRPRTEKEKEKSNIASNKGKSKEGYTKKGDNEDSDEEDVKVVYDESVQAIITDKRHQGEWIIVGWNSQVVKVMVIHATKQSVMCSVETIPDKIKFYPKEHFNGGSGSNNDMQEVRDLVNTLEVDDLCSSGFFYTWTKSLKNPNCSTLKKLDRILMNDSFITKYCRAHGIFLPYLISDHSPGLLIFPEGLPKKDVISRSLKDSLQVSQEDVEKDPFNMEKKKKAIPLLEEYIEISKDELKLLYQKAKINWLGERDKNTTFFHNILTAKKHKNIVESICDETGTRFWGYQVAIQIEKHFQNFLGTTNQMMPLEQLRDIIQLKLSFEDAEAMIIEVSDKEIKEAMFDIDSSKASSPDGYTSCFFKKAWSLIGNDVSSFSICINGEIYGYFKGGRVLRQGDLISPYLFTLVMEVLNMIMIKNIREANNFKYHYGCKEIKLTHLCFADDLLMLCNKDATSLKVIKNSLEEFSKVSGLFPNHSKSTVFFGIVKDLEKLFRRFLWNLRDFSKGKAKVAWSTVCKPKDQGGLGIKPLHKWNEIEDFPKLQHIPSPGIDNRAKHTAYWVNSDNKELTFLTTVAWRSLKENGPKVHYSIEVWDKIKVKGKMDNDDRSLYGVVDRIAVKPSNNNIWRILQRLIGSAVVYFIWQERNKRLFQDEKSVNMSFILVLVMPSIRASMVRGWDPLIIRRVFVEGNVARMRGFSMVA
ncbi:RNA-directed DNA polymerase, eukaryota, reverse transcriptase zinc-binding domain protein [Tanacetum coccineum]